jgi:hypothetical protein
VASAWERSPWRELLFALSDPHYYQFRFQSRGTGKDATFEAEARGDLNCNGVYSSFRLKGRATEDLGVEVLGPLIENETE